MCLFYETLYSSNHVCDDNIDTYLDSVNGICNLRNDEKDMCDLFPSIQECKNAVMDMKHNKSPGLDGIPNEYYQTFWNDLDTLFYDFTREVVENEEMSFSQKLGVISLIHKKGEKNLLKDYRPISLTNSDYKIISFIFAKRLQKVINDLIRLESNLHMLRVDLLVKMLV